jgi:hypothetical protein
VKAPGWARPPVSWERDADRGGSKAVRASQTARAQIDAVRAARYFAYHNARELGQGHAAAVRASNRVVRRVAKALGYSYPAAHELRF